MSASEEIRRLESELEVEKQILRCKNKIAVPVSFVHFRKSAYSFA
jgi:hypothetical protein